MFPMSKPVTVFEVLHDTDREGPAGDGTVIARFRREALAETFASSHTCYGRPATVSKVTVSRRLAQRWGMC